MNNSGEIEGINISKPNRIIGRILFLLYTSIVLFFFLHVMVLGSHHGPVERHPETLNPDGSILGIFFLPLFLLSGGLLLYVHKIGIICYGEKVRDMTIFGLAAIRMMLTGGLLVFLLPYISLNPNSIFSNFCATIYSFEEYSQECDMVPDRNMGEREYCWSPTKLFYSKVFKVNSAEWEKQLEYLQKSARHIEVNYFLFQDTALQLGYGPLQKNSDNVIFSYLTSLAALWCEFFLISLIFILPFNVAVEFISLLFSKIFGEKP